MSQQPSHRRRDKLSFVNRQSAECRQYFIERLDAALDAAKSLPGDGPVRAVLSDTHVAAQRRRAETERDLDDAQWPSLLMYAMAPWHTPGQLRLLDGDLTSIRDHETDAQLPPADWLAASSADDRKWRAGFFETAMKARALAFANSRDDVDVSFDVLLPSGRNADIKLAIAGKPYYLECTVITESDEDQQVHTAWLKARKTQPGLVLSRPGPFDSPGAKGPSSYYDANRFYIKVFDKLQKNGDPAKTQTSDDSPNLVLLSCFPALGSPLPYSPALGWAFDELFCGQPNMGSIKQMPPGTSVPDISLLTFLRGEWPNTADGLLRCPNRLSGALIFNCVGLQSSRVNYNAAPEHWISHAEMASLETVFTPLRGWENLGP
jgi:hypothetical protein